jgi:hypothetical protein
MISDPQIEHNHSHSRTRKDIIFLLSKASKFIHFMNKKQLLQLLPNVSNVIYLITKPHSGLLCVMTLPLHENPGI